jgi:hypothetical protein
MRKATQGSLPVVVRTMPAVSDPPATLSRRARHEADSVKDQRMPAAAQRRRAGLFSRLLTVRSFRGSNGQPKNATRPEAAVGALLDSAAAHGVLTLHHRCIPGRRGRIEHIAVGASGIYVIDVRHFKNASIEVRPSARPEGGAEDLVVGGRVMTAALVATSGRVAAVRALLAAVGLDDVPVHGAVCFVDGLLPLAVADLEVHGVHVMRPSGLTAFVAQPGDLSAEDREALQQVLAGKLPISA